MQSPDATRRTLIPAAVLITLNGLMMLLAPHVDRAPMTGTVFEFLRWSCVTMNALLLSVTLAALSRRQLGGRGVRMLWPVSLTGVLPTIALYLASAS